MAAGTIAAIIIAAVIVLIILILGIYTGATYNSLINLRNTVEEAFATMDVYLKKRWDLIPNIVESVKGYAKHEAQTLQNVISARNGNYNSMSAEQKMQANSELSRSLAGFNILAEQYPDLKANQNFRDLQAQLEGTENRISVERRKYNEAVKAYNSYIMQFPRNIFASMFGFKDMAYFNAEAGTEQAPQVQF